MPHCMLLTSGLNLHAFVWYQRCTAQTHPHVMYGSAIFSMLRVALFSLTNTPLLIWRRRNSCRTLRGCGCTPLILKYMCTDNWPMLNTHTHRPVNNIEACTHITVILIHTHPTVTNINPFAASATAHKFSGMKGAHVWDLQETLSVLCFLLQIRHDKVKKTGFQIPYFSIFTPWHNTDACMDHFACGTGA